MADDIQGMLNRADLMKRFSPGRTDTHQVVDMVVDALSRIGVVESLLKHFPHAFVPQDSTAIDEWSALIGVSLVAGTYTDVVTKTTSQGARSLILCIGMELSNPLSYQEVQWRLVQGGSALEGYEALRPRNGCLEQPLRLSVPSDIQPGQTIRLQALSNIAGIRAWGRLVGYERQPQAITQGYTVFRE